MAAKGTMQMASVAARQPIFPSAMASPIQYRGATPPSLPAR